jgi:hypothetical protein
MDNEQKYLAKCFYYLHYLRIQHSLYKNAKIASPYFWQKLKWGENCRLRKCRIWVAYTVLEHLLECFHINGCYFLRITLSLLLF